MAYVVTTEGEPPQRRETATAALELARELQAKKKVSSVEITDRDGAPLTMAQLEKLSEKELI